MIEQILVGWSGRGKPAGQLRPKEIEELWTRAMRWIAGRANELCPDGKPSREAIQTACNESGLNITEEHQKRIYDAALRERGAPGIPIVVSTERELEDEIEKARERGDIVLQAKRK